MPTIAHLSDPHLDGSTRRLRRLTRVVDLTEAIDADALLVTGDLADHGRADEYAMFTQAMPTERPWVAAPGNHDRRESARPFLGNGATGPLDRSLDVGPVRVVALDSLVEGQVEGRLARESLTFAEEHIRTAVGNVVLALHHPPVAVGHDLMDQYGLQNTDDLARLADHPAVTAVLVGHVHTSFATHFAGRPLLGAPGILSTMRLGSKTDPIADEAAMPGLAVHVFDESGWIRTVFHTLPPEP